MVFFDVTRVGGITFLVASNFMVQGNEREAHPGTFI